MRVSAGPVFAAAARARSACSARPWRRPRLRYTSIRARRRSRLLRRSTIAVPLAPANLTGTPFAELFLNLELEGTFRIEAETGAVSFRLRGGWLLGIRTERGSSSQNREQFYAIAAQRLSMSAHAESAPLIAIGGFRLLPELGASIPIPSITLDSTRYLSWACATSARPMRRRSTKPISRPLGDRNPSRAHRVPRRRRLRRTVHA